MKYLSLDLETTSLDPVNGQILQLACVVDDLLDPKPLDELPRLNVFIHHDEIKGQSFALQMNSWILEILAETEPLPEGAIMSNMLQISSGVYTDDNGNIAHTNNPVLDFLYRNFGGMGEKITVAGKNVAGFDIPFLPKPISSCFLHRVLDIGPLYMEKEDVKIPDMATCLVRAGIDKSVTHCALDDAFQVVKLIRAYFNPAGEV